MNGDDGAEFEIDIDCELKVEGSYVTALKRGETWFRLGEPVHLAKIEIILRAFTTIERLGLHPEGGVHEEEAEEEATEAREAPPAAEIQEEPEAEEPAPTEVPLTQVSEPKRMGTRDKGFTEAREEGIRLLKEGNKPKRVFELLQKAYGLPNKIATVYQWSSDLNKEAKKTSPKREGNVITPEEPKSIRPSEKKKHYLKGEAPKPRAPKIYDNLKTVPREDHDLMIVNGKVMCPINKVAIVCSGQECGKYIATLNVEGEPHIRCASAGV